MPSRSAARRGVAPPAQRCAELFAALFAARVGSVVARGATVGVALVVWTGCSGESTDDNPQRQAAASTGTIDDPTSTTAVGRSDDPSPRQVSADDIPVAFTPTGGWTEMPPPVLADCTESLIDGAIDMRGTWEVVSVEVDGAEATDHQALGERQRIEQCGDRVVITAGGIIHDMRADGTEKGGVNDVAASDMTTPITVVATFENGVHVLRPAGTPIEIRRRIDGDRLVWDYLGFTARLDRVDEQ